MTNGNGNFPLFPPQADFAMLNSGFPPVGANATKSRLSSYYYPPRIRFLDKNLAAYHVKHIGVKNGGLKMKIWE